MEANRWGGLVSVLDGLEPSRLPPAPFYLNRCTRVTDSEKWLHAMRCDVAAGLMGPRARTGALQEDLEDLGRILADRRTAAVESSSAVEQETP